MQSHNSLFPDFDPPARKKPGPKSDRTPEQKREAARAAQATHRAKLKAIGLCVACGQRRPRAGRKLCGVCLSKTKEKRRLFAADGRCQCGRKRPAGRSTCDTCRRSLRASEDKRYYRLRGERLCTECESPALPKIRLCAACREKERAAGVTLRMETFNAYGGPQCVCCGTAVPEWLTLEHPDNDGAQHRRKLGGKGGRGFYRRLKQLGFPQTPRMVVLCFNCNFARGLFGYCPCRRTDK